MDPLRIAVRIVFGWIVLQALVRISGKRTVSQGTPFDFTLALILGDMMDDLMWAVPASQFIVAVSTLVAAQTGLKAFIFRAGSWR